MTNKYDLVYKWKQSDKVCKMNNTFVSVNMQALTNDTLICMVHYRLNFIMITDVEWPSTKQ